MPTDLDDAAGRGCPVQVTRLRDRLTLVPMSEKALTVGQLWRLYEEYLGRQPFPPSQRRVAERLGMSPTALGNWRTGLSSLPAAQNLVRFAELTSVPYERVLDAALHDARYLPRPELIPVEARSEGLDPQERAELLEAIAPGYAEAAVGFDPDPDQVAADDDPIDPLDEAEETERST